MLLPMVGRGQQFEVTVTSERALPTRLTLAVYTNDSVPTILNPTQLANRGVSFGGRISRPMYAELRSPQLSSSLGFFLESASIQIVLNVADPERSKVVGSRMNSVYRYGLEQVLGDTSVLEGLVDDNPEEIYNASILLGALHCLTPIQVAYYAERLKGDARKVYPFRKLQEQLAVLSATMEGMKMPDFSFVADDGKNIRFRDVCPEGRCAVLLVGATWCEQCGAIEKQLRAFEKRYDLSVLSVHLDKHAKGWDAPFVRQLAVDHIPYLVVVDEKGFIAGRDIRIWQMERAMEEWGVRKR